MWLLPGSAGIFVLKIHDDLVRRLVTQIVVSYVHIWHEAVMMARMKVCYEQKPTRHSSKERKKPPHGGFVAR